MDPFLSQPIEYNNHHSQNKLDYFNSTTNSHSLENYNNLNGYESDKNFTTEETIVGIFYLTIGLVGSIMLSFVIITLIKQLGDRKGIYSLIKSNIWYELAFLIHMFKSGFGNLVDITNKLVCKVDSGFTFFTINMASFYYIILMIIMIYNKGHYPQMTKHKRLVMVLPAVLFGLISVILLFSYDLSGMSPWHSCYIKQNISVSISMLFIPQFIFLIVSIFFFSIVYMGSFSLTGIMRHFNVFCLFSSVFYIVLCISYYLKSPILGAVSFCINGILIIHFRMNCDVVVYSFNSGLSNNRIIHFLATLLCIDSPPIDSLALDLIKEEKLVINNLEKEKKISKRKEEKIKKQNSKATLNPNANTIKDSISADIEVNDKISHEGSVGGNTFDRNSGIN